MPGPPILAEIQRKDGVVPVAFCRPDGVVYVTAFTRARPEAGLYQEGVDLPTAFGGRVTRVDELTGDPIEEPAKSTRRAKGLVLRDVRVPYLPQSYTSRATEKIALPVFRITPQQLRRESSSH